MDPQTTENILTAVDLIAMIILALGGWIATVGSFIFGLFKTMGSILQTDKEPDFSYALKIAVVPFLYMFGGVVVYELARLIIDAWYSSNVHQNIINFYQFNINNYQFAGNINNVFSSISKETIQEVIDFMKAIFLGTSTLFYLLIYVFYFVEIGKFLNSQSVQKTNTLVLNILAALFVFITSIIIANMYDQIVSSILIPKTIHFNNIGDVNSIHEILTKTIKHYALLGLTQN